MSLPRQQQDKRAAIAIMAAIVAHMLLPSRARSSRFGYTSSAGLILPLFNAADRPVKRRHLEVEPSALSVCVFLNCTVANFLEQVRI